MSASGQRIRGRDFAFGLTAATALWTVAFSRKQRFWEAMAVGVGSLGAFALYANPALRTTRLKPRDVAVGLGTAVGLYGVFQVGDRVARKVVPSGAADIEDIYLRRTLADRRFIAGALALLIAPGEELFWRGLINSYLAQELGPVKGNAIGAAIYGGVHLVTRNFTLFGAAGIAGAFWSLQWLFEGRMASQVVSHVAWDVWIFLVQPTMELPEGR
ncbi:MAG: CPBP family intramembrane glutamic endopeptidase [Candidatus Dormibacteria bacterium]